MCQQMSTPREYSLKRRILRLWTGLVDGWSVLSMPCILELELFCFFDVFFFLSLVFSAEVRPAFFVLSFLAAFAAFTASFSAFLASLSSFFLFFSSFFLLFSSFFFCFSIFFSSRSDFFLSVLSFFIRNCLRLVITSCSGIWIPSSPVSSTCWPCRKDVNTCMLKYIYMLNTWHIYNQNIDPKARKLYKRLYIVLYKT